MGQEQGPEYYNSRLERLSIPLEASPWRDVYEAALDCLPAPPAAPVVDIGCGTGRLARLLYDRGYRDYWGFDFAEKRVEVARSYVPELSFSTASAFDDKTVEKMQAFGIFIVLEVLEHIHADRALLASLPAGAQVVLSVPSYDSGGHVRSFSGLDSVERRYGDLIRFDPRQSRVLPRMREPNRIFLLSGLRR